MSWLRSSPLRNSFSRQQGSIRTLDSAVNCDPKACYDSFCKHWQQAYDIIQKAQINRPPTHDDVLGVVSHLDHVITLLLLEVHHDSRLALSKDPSLSSLPANLWHSALTTSDAQNSTQSLALEENTHNTPCLEHLLSENLLDKLYEWGTTTGRYSNAVKLEQLKLYELLVSHSRQHLLVHEPFVRPLLKLLASCQGEIFPRDVEARLVVLLNQLCVSLMQNVHLLDLFFFTPQDHGSTNFVIFSLLIPFVHREGPVGHQARDALLLCMALSKKNTNIGMYIAKHSNVCPVLATGLSGLYSLLPTSLDIQSPEWHRLTPDDVNDISELSVFMNSLEFCNAVVQVAHPMIKQQLLDFLYQGFLVPVMGPALLQNGLEEQIAATAYFDLVLRSVTEPGLLKTLVRFLLDDNYDGTRLLDVLVQRIDSEDRLCLVSLALFESLIEINCEDIMLELIFRDLLTGDHLIIDCRYTNHLENANAHVDKFLSLSPSIVQTCSKITDKDVNKLYSQHDSPISRSMPTNWNHYGLYSCGTLYRNYHAYLCDARQKIYSCRKACESWANLYNTSQKHFEMSSNLDNSAQSANGDGKFDTSQSSSNAAESVHLYDVLREFIHEVSNLNMVDEEENFLFESVLNGNQEDESRKQLDSLQSLGDSSGYESFKYKPDECATVSDDSIKNVESSPDGNLTEEEKEAKANIMFSSGGDKDLVDQNCIGSFLAILFSKLQAMPSNSVYVNIHLTGLLSRLCVFPQDLLRTLLLSPHLQTRAPIRSLYQILLSVREYIDTSLSVQVIDAQQIAEQAREFLMERECRLVNARKNAIEAANQNRNALNNSASGATLFDAKYRAVQSNNRTAFAAQYSSTNYDPFKRSEPKRKSISSSLSQMFRRTNLNAASSSLSSIYEFFTGFPNHQSNSSSGANNETQTPPDTVSYSPSTYWGNEANKNLLHESGDLLFGQSPSSQTNITLYNLVMSAVILDEWVKELAAIVQEHNIEYLNKGLRCV